MTIKIIQNEDTCKNTQLYFDIWFENVTLSFGCWLSFFIWKNKWNCKRFRIFSGNPGITKSSMKVTVVVFNSDDLDLNTVETLLTEYVKTFEKQHQQSLIEE